MKPSLPFACLSVALLGSLSSSSGQDLQAPELTVETIYGSKAFSAKSFNSAWSNEGHTYAIQQDSKTLTDDEGKSLGKDIVARDAVTGEETVLLTAEQLVPAGREKPLEVASYAFTNDDSHALLYTNTKRVWRQNTRGDYWVLNLKTSELRQLGGDRPESSLMFAKFSPDGKSVGYVHDRNIYVEEVATGKIRALTTTDSEHIINGTSDWVNEEELSIRDGFRWSPDGSQIAYWQFDTSGVPEMTMIDNTSGRYPKLITFTYPKAGQKNSAVKVGVVDVASAETTWVPLKGDLRNHYVARIQWAPAKDDVPAELMIQHLNRLQNTNRLLMWNADTQSTREVLVETDDTWVDVHDELFWLKDGQHFTWVSERSGWRRIYLADRDSGQLQPITPANLDAIELLAVDDDLGLAYVLASPENATQLYLYTVKLDGSDWKRISPADQSGSHSYRISADGKFAVHTFSNLTTPPVIDLVKLPGHEEVRDLEDNAELAAKVQQVCTAEAGFQRVPIQDDVELDSWYIQPTKREPGKKYPLFVYVYGEPAGTTVKDRWMGSSYLWYQMLAQQGYVVMSFDNRGTPAPRGRAWRKSIYERIGINAHQDQADAVKRVLSDRSDLDSERVGVWGWSGGGSMTLNAMFHYPDLYHTGISIAPVPDQLGYDTIYQERYMGLPSENVAGYRDGSSIHVCDQLKGNLLLIHGTGDDNCHYATMEQLIDKLIEHNRPFEMMSYPNRTHAIREGKNTTLHLRTLMTEFLNRNLPAGPVQ